VKIFLLLMLLVAAPGFAAATANPRCAVASEENR